MDIKTIDRRQVLRGVGGACMALPLLNLFIDPVLGAKAKHSVQKRAFFYYLPNGVINRDWNAKLVEGEIELAKSLHSLKSIRHKVNLFKGLNRHRVPGIDGHSQAGSCWLTSVNAQTHQSSIPHPIDRTVDQLIGDRFHSTSVFRTLELSCNSFKDNKEAIHFDAISWYGPGNVAHPIKNPLLAFDRLFNIKKDIVQPSVLDLVKEDSKSLKRVLGRDDQRKLDEYFENVSSIEHKVMKLKKKQHELVDIGKHRPSQAPVSRFELMRMMMDISFLSFQTEMTPVISLMAASRAMAYASTF